MKTGRFRLFNLYLSSCVCTLCNNCQLAEYRNVNGTWSRFNYVPSVLFHNSFHDIISSLDPIKYMFVSRAEVEALSTYKQDVSKFALKLELAVYKDLPNEMKTLVDERMQSADRVQFIKKVIIFACICK